MEKIKYAIQEGEPEILEDLISDKLDYLQSMVDEDDFLNICFDTVSQIIETFKDVDLEKLKDDIKDYNNQNKLFSAVINDDMERIKRLMKIEYWRYSSIDYPALAKSIEVAELLLGDRDPNEIRRIELVGRTENILDFYLSKGLKPNKLDYNYCHDYEKFMKLGVTKNLQLIPVQIIKDNVDRIVELVHMGGAINNEYMLMTLDPKILEAHLKEGYYICVDEYDNCYSFMCRGIRIYVERINHDMIKLLKKYSGMNITKFFKY